MSDRPSDPPQPDDPQPENTHGSAATSPDPSLERLRASDPAAVTESDLAAIRREVDRRISATDAPVPVAQRRGADRWLRVAAVAAGVALVGSASFVVGRQTVGGPDTSATVAAAGSEPQPAAGAPSVAGPRAGGPVPGAAAEAAVPGVAGGAQSASTTQDRSLIGGWGGRTHFNDGGLSTEGGDATAWGYDPAQVLSAATAERVAAAMGISGSASVQYQGWVVGPPDGSGPSVALIADGVASVSYHDPAAYPSCDAPVTAAEGEPGGATAGDGGGAKPDVGCTPSAPTGLGADEAIDRSTEILSRIGVDPAGLEFSSPDDGAGSGYRTVLATGSVAGLAAAGPQWTVSFVGDRLASFYGGLAPLVDLGEYPVISPAAAVARMNDPRFGALPGPYPIDTMPAVGTAEPGLPADPDTGTVTAPPAPTPGAPVAWPVTEVALTGATLGLSSQYQADGSTLLLPSWTMTDDAGSSWTVVAVSDDRMDFSS